MAQYQLNYSGSEINQLLAKISVLESKLNTLQTTVNNIDTSFIQSELNTVKQQVQSINDELDAKDTIISNIQAKLTELENTINSLNSSIDSKDAQVLADSKAYTDEQILKVSTGGSVDLSGYAKKTDLPTRTSQLENNSGFITEVPAEYITETELSTELANKANTSDIPSLDGYATETYVQNKIAEASIGGGGGSTVDLSGLGADLSLNGQTLKLKNSSGQEIGTGVTLPQTSSVDAYTKTETDNLIQDYTGGKKQVYLTQAEYDLLTVEEKNDSTKVFNITDAAEKVIPTDLTIDSNNLLQLKGANGNAIGTGVTVSTASEYTLPTASSTVLGGIKVGDRLSIDSNGVLSADIQESTTSNEVILTSPSGYRFKVIVNDEGVLSTEEIVTLGNIIASVSELSINEGENTTFTISLSETPTRAQTITIVSDNTDVTVNPSSIDISDTNPHTITVSVAEDEGDYADETAVLTLTSPKVSNVTINVSIKDNDIEPKPCTGITLDQTSISVSVARTKQLNATVTPEGCTDEIVWSTSNANCTVVNGLVKGVTEGDCIITATCGGYSATCNVTITAKTSKVYLYDNGDKCEATTGGLTLETVTDNGTYLTIPNGWSSKITTVNPIQLDAYDTVYAKVKAIGSEPTNTHELHLVLGENTHATRPTTEWLSKSLQYNGSALASYVVGDNGYTGLMSLSGYFGIYDIAEWYIEKAPALSGTVINLSNYNLIFGKQAFSVGSSQLLANSSLSEISFKFNLHEIKTDATSKLMACSSAFFVRYNVETSKCECIFNALTGEAESVAYSFDFEADVNYEIRVNKVAKTVKVYREDVEVFNLNKDVSAQHGEIFELGYANFNSFTLSVSEVQQ